MAEAQDRFRDIILAFLREAGIPVREMRLDDPFLPGLDIRDGTIVVDWTRLPHVGDLLHEAGHLAVTAPVQRNAQKLDPTPGDEMAAIAWSYAASVHLGVPIEVLFHPAGYKGGSDALIAAYREPNPGGGFYLGTPLLSAYGMTIEPRRARPGGPPPYPHMLRWLR